MAPTSGLIKHLVRLAEFGGVGDQALCGSPLLCLEPSLINLFGAVGRNTRCVCYWSVVPWGWGGTIFVPSRDRVIVPSCLSDLPDNDTTECSIQGDVSVAPPLVLRPSFLVSYLWVIHNSCLRPNQSVSYGYKGYPVRFNTTWLGPGVW